MNKKFVIPVALYILCLFVRLLSIGEPAKVLSGDEFEYYSLSDGLLQGEGYAINGVKTAWRTPGYPFFLAGLRTVFGDQPATIRLVSIFIVSLIAPLVYLLCLALFKEDKPKARRIGIFAGLIWVGMRNSIFLSGTIGGEEIATLLFLIYLLLACKALERYSLKWLLAATVVLAAAILIRGYLLFISFVLPLLFIRWRQWKPAVLALLLSALLLGTWAYRNYRAVGQFTFSTETAEVMWLGNSQFAKGGSPGPFNSRECFPDQVVYNYLTNTYPGFCKKTELEKSRIFENEIRESLPWFIKNGIKLIPKKTLIFFTPVSWLGTDFVYLVALLLSVVGFASMFVAKKLDTKMLAIIVMPVFFCLSISLLTYSDIRHRHPINAQVAILGSVGLYVLVDRFRSLSRRDSREQVVK